MKHASLLLTTFGLWFLVGCSRNSPGDNKTPPASPPQPQAPLSRAEPVEELKEPTTKSLIEAARLGNVNDVKVYLRRDPEAVRRPDAAGFVPIHYAAERDRSEVIRVLLRAGSDVNAPHPKVKATPLQYAAAHGHLDAVRTLIAAGAKVDSADSNGRTPLAWAAWKGKAQVVQELLKHNAAVGFLPIHLAAGRGHGEVIQVLVRAGVDLNTSVPEVKATPLQYAATDGNLDAVRLLIAAGAKVDCVDSQGRTPLMWAASKGKAQVVQELLKHGADVSRTTQTGWTALRYAEESGDPEVVKLLRK